MAVVAGRDPAALALLAVAPDVVMVIADARTTLAALLEARSIAGIAVAVIRDFSGAVADGAREGNHWPDLSASIASASS